MNNSDPADIFINSTIETITEKIDGIADKIKEEFQDEIEGKRQEMKALINAKNENEDDLSRVTELSRV